MDKIKKVLFISSDHSLREVLHFCFDGWGYEVFMRDSLKETDLTAIKKISPDVVVLDVHAARHSDLRICSILKNDFITAFIPVITLINKRHLRSQLLNLKHGVDDYLIKPPDPLDLRTRIEMAIKRTHHSFYSSPLTGLPGARIIEEVVKEKITSDSSFSFAYIDIDNFKFFNDVYGYIKGDRVIMQTAYMLYTVIQRYGGDGDLIGHIGGDDFVCITSPEKYTAVCQNFIYMFDTIMPFHYSFEDRKRGFIVARDRTHKISKKPLVSVSVAVVNRSAPADIKTIVDINERIAEIKKYLKNIEGSKFMADRRTVKQPGNTAPLVYKKERELAAQYKPLGQILREKNIISDEQLDEALRDHWRKGVVFGEVLKELGYLSEKELSHALGDQKILFSRGRLHERAPNA